MAVDREQGSAWEGDVVREYERFAPGPPGPDRAGQSHANCAATTGSPSPCGRSGWGLYTQLDTELIESTSPCHYVFCGRRCAATATRPSRYRTERDGRIYDLSEHYLSTVSGRHRYGGTDAGHFGTRAGLHGTRSKKRVKSNTSTSADARSNRRRSLRSGEPSRSCGTATTGCGNIPIPLFGTR